jgi:hypothetical protein
MSDEVDRLREEIAQVRHYREEADAERDDWRARADALHVALLRAVTALHLRGKVAGDHPGPYPTCAVGLCGETRALLAARP